jgi:hypothetical protein
MQQRYLSGWSLYVLAMLTGISTSKSVCQASEKRIQLEQTVETARDSSVRNGAHGRNIRHLEKPDTRKDLPAIQNRNVNRTTTK